MTLVLTKWKPSQLKENRLILVIGRRGSGKSTVLKNILYELWIRQTMKLLYPTLDIGDPTYESVESGVRSTRITKELLESKWNVAMEDRITIPFSVPVSICPTRETWNMLNSHLPPCFNYDSYKEKIVDDVSESCKKLTNLKKQRSALLVLDDCMFDTKIMNTRTMREIAMNGRNYGITMINCMQYCMDLPVSIRSQIDYVVVMAEKNRSNRERLYKYFFGVFHQFKEFEMVMEKTTANYGALVLDNTSADNTVPKSVFWYKGALEVPDFKLGNPVYYQLTEKCPRLPIRATPIKGESIHPSSTSTLLTNTSGKFDDVVFSKSQ